MKTFKVYGVLALALLGSGVNVHALPYERGVGAGAPGVGVAPGAVSYTHLTLPTKRIV